MKKLLLLFIMTLFQNNLAMQTQSQTYMAKFRQVQEKISGAFDIKVEDMSHLTGEELVEKYKKYYEKVQAQKTKIKKEMILGLLLCLTGMVVDRASLYYGLQKNNFFYYGFTGTYFGSLLLFFKHMFSTINDFETTNAYLYKIQELKIKKL